MSKFVICKNLQISEKSIIFALVFGEHAPISFAPYGEKCTSNMDPVFARSA